VIAGIKPGTSMETPKKRTQDEPGEPGPQEKREKTKRAAQSLPAAGHPDIA
jgi:hypothetical protein